MTESDNAEGTDDSLADIEPRQPVPTDLALGSLLSQIPSQRKHDVFVSYGANQDQRIAKAVKLLLESSIEPAPSVFVSGAGGIRPSKLGSRPQMKMAAQQATAFIGIITQASKERQWIFYEAGAAWGQDKVYVPLLIGTVPEDLHATLAEFQAVRAAVSEELAQLVDTIAEALGGAVRPQLRRRLSAFQKGIQDDPAESEIADLKADARAAKEITVTDADDFWSIVTALENARYQDADDRFARLLTREDLAERIPSFRILFTVMDPRLSTDATRTALEEFTDPKVRAQPEYHYWRARYETHDHAAIAYYEQYLAVATTGPFSMLATTNIARCKHRLCRTNEAVELLMPLLARDSRADRIAAAATLLEIAEQEQPLSRLLLICIALSGGARNETLRMATTLAESEGWPALAIFFAQTLERLEASGDASNRLGNILSNLGKRELAYEAYGRADDAGVNVGKLNMARLHSNGPSHAAALKMLDSHVGKFNAHPTSHPFEIRAASEKAVADERALVAKIATAGEIVFQSLCEIADYAATHSPASEPDGGLGFRLDGVYRLEAIEKRGELCRAEEAGDVGMTARFEPVLPFVGVWSATNDSIHFIITRRRSGAFECLRLNLQSELDRPRRITLMIPIDLSGPGVIARAEEGNS